MNVINNNNCYEKLIIGNQGCNIIYWLPHSDFFLATATILNQREEAVVCSSNSIKKYHPNQNTSHSRIEKGLFFGAIDASAAENLAQSDRRKVCKQFARIFSVMTFQ